MTVGPRNNKVIVVAPFVGTPAYRAGLRPGDVIISVDGKPTDNMNVSEVADLLIEVDRPLFTFTFTYKVTDRASGVLLASGKVTAFDGNTAAPDLAQRILKDMRAARGETKNKK